MNRALFQLRATCYGAAANFHQAQRKYADMARDDISSPGLRPVLLRCLETADLYAGALSNLHDALLDALPFDGRDKEIKRTIRFLDIVAVEKQVFIRLLSLLDKA